MFNLNELIGLDFETYGAVSLPAHGLERYAADKTFTALIGSTTTFDGRHYREHDFDFVIDDFEDTAAALEVGIGSRYIVAHNAGFEQRVLRTMGLDYPSSRFIDSAVVARALGAGGKLEAAAPQLLGVDKMVEGRDLMRLFSIPTKEKLESGDLYFDPSVVYHHPNEWNKYKQYCRLDSRLGLRIALRGFELGVITDRELWYQAVTMDMNNRGWHVDVDKVEEMQRRYLENQEVALAEFRAQHGTVLNENGEQVELNLNSLKQLKEWCAERGIKATSFNEESVEKLAARIDQKLDTMLQNDPKRGQYYEVLQLLRTKQILGGSSLKKLVVILDTVGEDGRLRDQYLHIGAGQSWRTTGRSVQMQNLKRLPQPADMDTLEDPDSEWTNEELAENIRQVFTATDPDGAVVVGDFSSIESRGLAWLANENWKLQAYRQGQDMYKVLASEIYSTSYDLVTKLQRQTGKVGELSCGYGAGGGAVQSFAAGMGVTMTEAEAAQLVFDWRAANPQIVDLWSRLDEGLHTALAVASGWFTMPIGYDYMLRIERADTPATLTAQHPGAQSLQLTVLDSSNQVFMVRLFHGCYLRGRNVCFYKPSQLKGGDLWSNHYTDPKTKQVKFYSIYGGKLAGILTQSFCRELFFRTLRKVASWCDVSSGVDLVGQFHDEIVLDWAPVSNGVDLSLVKLTLHNFMSDATGVPGFPMDAEIKHDYRYTK